MNNSAKTERANQEKRWLEQMEELGVETVHARFVNRMAVTDLGPYPEGDFVQRWLINKRQEAWYRSWARYWFSIFVAAVAAVASCIAAWPVMQEWAWVKSLLH
jgi:hypothetical protein